tara:strand:+ start:468 stop:680 length:213 start_codon:yes stop_codon:yes gene_type:complete
MCLLLTLGLAVGIMGCSGWSIMGYDLEGNNDSVFHEIIQDSVTHYYRDIRVGENWCFFHQQYENVELVSE